MTPKIILPLLFTLFASIAQAECPIYYNDAPLTQTKQDPLSLLLQKAPSCPQSIQDFKQLLQDNQLKTKTSMVANRGKNNPNWGSFSFFESISGTLPGGFSINSGEFYLGYFTDLEAGHIKLDQQLEPRKKLLIELIAWDQQTHLFNFYELYGLDTSRTQWYYRGNSADALADNHYLYRNPPSKSAKFGNRMRCSACHNSGGPIMKELKTPHNDWWSADNPLIFLPNHPDNEVDALVNLVIDAEDFAKEVGTGVDRLAHSDAYQQVKNSLELQEQLRPLFCTTEINIESNQAVGLQNPIAIPSDFFINPLLAQIDIAIPAQAYQSLLTKNQMRFPETDLQDADHAWLTPVKGSNDIQAIQQLIENKKITLHFAQSVLMIDYAHPVFSRERCELLKLLPGKAEQDWVSAFIEQLLHAPKKSAAALLASYLLDEEHYNPYYFQKLLSGYAEALRETIKSPQGLQEVFIQLVETRQAVLDNELSKNPRGQILEPQFRVIFPVPRG